MNSETFNEYVSAVLLLYIHARRSKQEFAAKDAVLFMDNCPVHGRADTPQNVANQRVRMAALPPHTIHMFQSFDLSLSGNFKKRMNCKLLFESDATAACFIKCIFQMTKQILIPDNVHSSFLQVGLC
jgi:hypothetical protein